jgi:tetratricopeptide (TPR) repeat protein
MLEEAFAEIDESDIEQRAITLLRQAIVERDSKRLNEALKFHNQAKPLFERIDNHLLIASFHLSYANTLNRLSSAEDREDYVDLALIEYIAASFHYEQAGHERYEACVEINLGVLLGKIGKFHEAHEHLDRAQMVLTRLKDNVHLAQVDDTRANVWLSERRYIEAEKTARTAVARLERSDELSLLAEALITHGIALTRLAHRDAARKAFERAIAKAEQAGNFEQAGVAALTLIEQLGGTLSEQEVCALIDHARTLLDKTEDIEPVRRLAKSAIRVLFTSHLVTTPPDWKDFSLKQAIGKFEANLIEKALKESDGSVTHASRLLGLKHHQSLINLLDTRRTKICSTFV